MRGGLPLRLDITPWQRKEIRRAQARFCEAKVLKRIREARSNRIRTCFTAMNLHF
ncbi:hypothetical protein [Geosporobacter subterraneus]|uniref:hypothetical protein n=1 Tax=Geosporobacter subterraneus TaxID=390806 RepID=UPI0016775DF9|nr:hypothetical protein [Geosporobacter subterraneus]